MEFGSAPDSATRTQWLKALDEYGQAMSAHDDYFSARSADLPTVDGHWHVREIEIPLTVNDMAQAWAFLDPPEYSIARTIADTSYTNFGNLAAQLDRAHKLEPAAELRPSERPDARGAGDRPDSFDLPVNRPSTVTRSGRSSSSRVRNDWMTAFEKDVVPMSELAIFADAYRDRFRRLQEPEEQHFSAAVQIVDTLGSGEE